MSARFTRMVRIARLKRLGILGVVAVGASLVTFGVMKARAAGIPDADVLTYTGYLEDADGAPLNGAYAIDVTFYGTVDGDDELCSGEAEDFELVSGRFQVPLPDCVASVQANPNIWVEVEVDATTLGRTKLGAVPFAVEAGHATTADEATHAEVADTATNAPVVTEWVTYAGTVSTGGVAIPGSTVTSTWRRIGDSAEIKIEADFVAAAGVTGGWRFNLPAGLQIDFTKHVQGVDVVGVGRTNFGGTESMCTAQTQPANPTSVSVNLLGTTALAGPPNDGHYASIMFTVPIVGWTATTPAP
jgi:hypothetical protein